MSDQVTPGGSRNRLPAVLLAIIGVISAAIAVVIGLLRRLQGKAPQVTRFRDTPLTVVIPYQGKSLRAVERPIPSFETLQSPQDEFRPAKPPSLNFEVVDAGHSDRTIAEFDPPLILEIEFTEEQVKAAQEAAQAGKLPRSVQQLAMPYWGFWDGSHWVVFTKEKHSLDYTPNGKTKSGVISTVKLKRWADPPIGWGPG